MRSELVASPPIENLLDFITPREKDVLALIAQGFSNRAIANMLFLEEKTVEGHINAMHPKIGVDGLHHTFNPRVKSVLLYQENTPSFKNPFDEIRLLKPFAPREKEVTSLIGQGYSNTTIAERLGINEKTVENYINHILQGMPVNYQIYHHRVTIALVSQTKHAVR